jgi:allantoin racemase
VSLKIHTQNIYPPQMPGFDADGEDGYAVINAGVRKVYEKVLRPDTEVTMNYVPRSTFHTSHAYLELLNNAEIVRGVIRGAEEEGADVAFVRCGNDPGILAARESVAIPVVGMSEAALHTAAQLGSKFAVIGVDDKSLPLFEANLLRYRLEGHAISRLPVRMPEGPDFQEVVRAGAKWFGDPDFVWDKVVPPFEEVARGCIADGAEIIVTGCALMAALTLADYRMVSGTQVPVLESVAVGIKTAEMWGDLYRSVGLTTSKHRTYRSDVDPTMRDMLAAPFFPANA